MQKLRRFHEGQEGLRSECRVDRFSDLPEELARRIISSLTITDLTRFGGVSKTCRELYLSTQALNFDKFSKQKVSTCDKWLRVSDSLNRFLIRRGDKKIQHFRIHQLFDHYPSCVCYDDNCEMIKWVEMAIRCKVEVLDLDIDMYHRKTPFEFPSFIFLCGSLRSLLVTMPNTIIKAPSFTCSSTLECLKLTCVAVEEKFFKWISSSCNCIKELQLKSVRGEFKVITIESSSLVSLSIWSRNQKLCDDLKISGEKLQYMHIDLGVDCRLNICAPNLKCLKWFGYIVNHQLGKLLCLEKAEIGLDTSLLREDDCGKVVEVLHSISRVKVLTLHEVTILALLKEDLLPPPFDDVSDLQINIGSFFDELVPTMVSLFRGMPNLSTLYLKYSTPKSGCYPETYCSGFVVRYWKLQNFPFISQLKDVTIELSEDFCGYNPIEFSRFILNHAQNVKKIVKRKMTNSNGKVVFHRK